MNFTNRTPAQPLAALSPSMIMMEPLEITIPVMLSCVIAVISNIFVCYLIVTVRRLKTVTNVFVFSLCICDVLFAGILLPLHCFYQQSLVYQYMTLITVLIYIANLTAVTFERLYSITKPMKYHQFITKRRAIKITIASWIIPFLYCLLPLLWGNDTTTLAHKIYLIGTLVVFLIGPLIFIVFVYIKVCLEIKKMFDYEKKFRVATVGTQRKTVVSESIVTVCCLKFEKSLKESSKGIAVTSSTALRVALSPQHINYDKCSQEDKMKNEERYSISEYSNESSDSFGELYTNSTRLHSIDETCTSVTPLQDRSISMTSNLPSRLKLISSSSSLGERGRSTPSIDARGLKNGVVMRDKKRSLPKTRVSLISQNVKLKSNMNKMKNKMTELKASFAFGIVAFTYMFTWLPVAIMTFLVALDKPQYITQSMVIFSIFAITVNALSDPFLYGMLLLPFRTTIKHVFRKMCCPY